MAEPLFGFGARDVQRIGRAVKRSEGQRDSLTASRSAALGRTQLVKLELVDACYAGGEPAEAHPIEWNGTEWETDTETTTTVDGEFLTGYGLPGRTVMAIPGPGDDMLAMAGGIHYVRGSYNESEGTVLVDGGDGVTVEPEWPYGLPSDDGVTVGCVWNDALRQWEGIVEPCEE